MSITMSCTIGNVIIPARIHILKLTHNNSCPLLPSGLKYLDIQNSTFKRLPPIPEELEVLWNENTPITSPQQQCEKVWTPQNM
jgi:hypothetical protein